MLLIQESYISLCFIEVSYVMFLVYYKLDLKIWSHSFLDFNF